MPLSRYLDTPRLRAEAEARIPLSELSGDTPLDYELRVHQIELEMQNEALRQAQIQLEAARDRYHELFDNAPVGYLVVTEAGLVHEANFTALSMLWIKSSELTHRRFDHFIAEHERTRWNLLFARVRRNYHAQDGEFTLLRAGEDAFPAHLNCARHGLASDCVRVTITPLTQHSAGTSGAPPWLHDAGHALRQPLAAIRLCADLLGKAPLPPEHRAVLGDLREASASLQQMLTSVLDLARLDAGESTPALAPHTWRASDLFGWVEDHYGPAFAARGIRLDYASPRTELLLRAEPAVLQGLLARLLDNAGQYGGRRVLLSVRRRGAQALLQVWDAGLGMAPEHLSRLVEPGYRVPDTAASAPVGLGLGLTIAARQAARLGTRLTCHSRPGRGSVFSLLLPLAR